MILRIPNPSVQDRNDSIAIFDRERSARTKIVLHIDNQQRVTALHLPIVKWAGGKMIIELGHGDAGAGETASSSPFTGLRAMVCESIGAVRHEVSVPFHDSQVRGAALLIQTGWDQYWDADAYWEPGPFLAEHLIFRMVRSGVRVVGVDFPVTERTQETRLITGGKIAIVENLRNLASLPRVGFRFSAVPLDDTPGAIRAVRAFAEIA